MSQSSNQGEYEPFDKQAIEEIDGSLDEIIKKMEVKENLEPEKGEKSGY
jgi:hypothetical protein